MSQPYIPGIWAKQYEALPRARKDQINSAVNTLFEQETGVRKRLDPERDIVLVRQWLRIRDALMEWLSAGKTLEAALNSLNELGKLSSGHFLIEIGGAIAQLLTRPPKVSANGDQIEFSVGAVPRELQDWVRTGLRGRGLQKDVSLVRTDSDFRPESRMKFDQLTLDEVIFPAVDASNKSPCQLTLKARGLRAKRAFVPDEGRRHVPRSKVQWIASNFKLDIDGLSTDKVVAVDAITAGRRGSELVVTARSSELAAFTVLFTSSRRPSGTLRYLDPNMTSTILSLAFGGLSAVGRAGDGGTAGTFKARFSISNLSAEF